MEPIDYIKTFKMAEENYEFNRAKFFKQFKEEFLDYIENDTLGLDAEVNMHFERFREIVSSFNQKFLAISRLRASMRADHEGLTKRLWGYFYAHVVLPEREKRFPREHASIKARYLKKAAKRAKEDPNP